MIRNPYIFGTPFWTNLIRSYPVNGDVLDHKGVNNGAIVGTTSYVAGLTGQAIQSNGINGGISLPDNTFDITTDFTFCISFKHNATSSNSFPFTVYDGTRGFYIYELGGTYRFIYNGLNVIANSGAWGATFHTWVFTLQGTTLKWYENGVLAGTYTVTTCPASVYECGLLYLKYTNAYFYDGIVDNILWTNDVKDATWILAQYNGGAVIEYV